MARPAAKELTERELEIMHVFWEQGEQTASDIRDRLSEQGRELAYTTVATLVRILFEKGFIIQINDQRPFRFKPARPFEDVSKSMVGDMIDRLFGGSREQLLLRMFDGGKMTRKEREALENLLRENKP
jgi:BlaI family transcriptional regulator, penicillinase repressor